MIVLFTNDTKIEVLEDNPVYEQLVELDGKFVGVSYYPAAVEEVAVEETEFVTVDGEAYFAELEDIFSKDSMAYHLLVSNANRFLSSLTMNIKVHNSRVNPHYRIATDSSGYLIAIPNRFIK